MNAQREGVYWGEYLAGMTAKAEDWSAVAGPPLDPTLIRPMAEQKAEAAALNARIKARRQA